MSRYDVFLSYNKADKPAVDEIARRLVKVGIQPWLDEWNLIPGEPWQEAIEGALASCATCAVFVGPSGTGPWQNEEMRAAIDRRVSECKGSFRVIPVLLPGAQRGERSKLPTFLVATTWVEFRQTLDEEDAFHRLISGIRGQAPGPGPGQAIFEGVCPYRGLQFFDVEHAPFFFGREALTEWLLDELRGDNRFLAIVGPSGSGKSSLARAGLVAALKQGRIAGSEQWPVVVTRPGADPLESLAVALTPYTSDPLALANQLREDERRLHYTTRVALREASSKHRFVLLVDQFEELFTMCRAEELRKAFIDNLLYAATSAQGQTTVLLALRADFYGKCAMYPHLTEALSDHHVLVGPMTDTELRLSIERPAQLVGLQFDVGLVDVLLRDVRDQPGYLPLLQHALLELWGQREGCRLTHAGYKEIGGVAGALERRAETVYKSFTPEEQEICRRIFLRLTQLREGTEGTKRRVSIQELLPVEGEYNLIVEVVQKLAEEDVRLIVVEGRGTLADEQFIEVAHEALIQGWNRLHAWIDEDFEALRVHRRLTEAAMEWNERKRDDSFLYRGIRLIEAGEWVEAHQRQLNPLELEFWTESMAQWEQEQQESEARRQHELEVARKLAEEQLRFNTELSMAAAKAEFHTRMARASQLTALAQVALTTNEDPSGSLPLLLAREAVLITLGVDDYTLVEACTALRNAIVATPPWIMTLPKHRHTAVVNSVVFSPDGKTLVTASNDSTSRLWDALSGRQISMLSGHMGAVNFATFSPSGQVVATASKDGTVRLWDVATAQETKRLEGHSGIVNCVAFSPDGKTVATGGIDRVVRIWDVVTGLEIGQLRGHSSHINAVVFSPDGTTLLTASGNLPDNLISEDNTARLWDVATAQEIVQLSGHTGVVLSAAFSPSGKTIITSGGDSTARLWDSSTGHEIKRFEYEESDWVKSANFSRDEKMVVTVGGDHYVRLWNTDTGTLIRKIKVHSLLSATWVTFGMDGRTIVTAGEDMTARIWNIHTGYELQRFGCQLDTLTSIAFSPNGRMIAAASQNSVQEDDFLENAVWVWNIDTESVNRKLLGHARGVNAVAFSPDGKMIVTASQDGTACLWDIATGKCIRVFIGHINSVDAIAFSPDGKTVATGGEDSTIRLWSISTGREIQRFADHTQGVYFVAFSPDGTMIVTASSDKTMRVWNIATGQETEWLRKEVEQVLAIDFESNRLVLITNEEQGIRVWDGLNTKDIQWFKGNMSHVQSVHFSPDKRSILTAGGDGTFRVWDIVTGQETLCLIGHDGTTGLGSNWVNHAKAIYNPDGQMIATTISDQTIRLWKTRSIKETWQLKGHSERVNCANFSPNGKMVVTASSDGTSLLWDMRTGQQIQQLVGHAGQVWSAVFSPDGMTILTASGDGTARLWSVSSGQEIAQLKGGADLMSALFSPDGSLILTSEGLINNSAVRLWDGHTYQELQQVAGSSGFIDPISFCPSGEKFLFLSTDGAALLWNVDPCQEIMRLQVDSVDITAVRFSPNGKTIITVGADKSVRLWNTNSGKEIQKIQVGAEVDSALFDPSGEMIVTVGKRNRIVQLWEVETRRELRRWEYQQENGPNCANFSPDGRWLIIAGDDNIAHLEITNIRDLLELAGTLIQRDPPIFTPQERNRFGIVHHDEISYSKDK